MIPNILIIIGILSVIGAIIGLMSILLLPVTKLTGIVYKRKDDYLKYEINSGKSLYAQSKKQLTWIYVMLLLAGIILLSVGMYLGYAAKGDDFWFYRQVFGAEVHREEYWDQITEDGKFIAKTGKVYTYYIVVRGNEYLFCGENCEGEEKLEEQIKSINRANSVILIDDYAVASAYHFVKKLLNENGIDPEEEDV